MLIKKILHSIKSKPKCLLGVDINANSIRLVELSITKSNYQIETCINTMLTSPMSDDMVAVKLKGILQQTRPKTKDVAVALSHSAIIFKEVKVAPELSNKELTAFLQFNLEKYIGESADNVSFDYQSIRQPQQKGKRTILQLIVARRDRVEKYIKLLQAANLCPKVIDIASYALERIARQQYKNFSGLIAIINIDYETILIVVINQKKIVYVHEDFVNTAAMQSTAQITMQLKLQLQFVFAALPQPLEKIILAGEKATFVGLNNSVSEQFNIPTVIINPFFALRLSPTVSQESVQKIAAAMAISCGLALRAADVGWN